jgi:hypothetical protein
MIPKIKTVMKDSRFKIDTRLKKAKVISRGWWNYPQYSDMNQINLWPICYWMYKYLQKSTKMPSQDIIQELGEIFNGHRYRVNRQPATRGT